MPFGLASAPRDFSFGFKHVMALFRKRGMRCMFYIDNLLFLASSRQQALSMRAAQAAAARVSAQQPAGARAADAASGHAAVHGRGVAVSARIQSRRSNSWRSRCWSSATESVAGRTHRDQLRKPALAPLQLCVCSIPSQGSVRLSPSCLHNRILFQNINQR